MAKQILVIGVIIAFIVTMANVCLTDVPHLISFQGKLYDNAGNPLTGEYEITPWNQEEHLYGPRQSTYIVKMAYTVSYWVKRIQSIRILMVNTGWVFKSPETMSFRRDTDSSVSQQRFGLTMPIKSVGRT